MSDVIIAAIIGAVGGIITTIITAIFVMKVGSKEKSIINKIKSVNKPSQIPKGILIRRTNDFISELINFLRKAEREIIFIGGSMRKFPAAEDIIHQLIKEKNIKVKILALNIEKDDVFVAFKKLLGDEFVHKNVSNNLKHLEDFKDSNPKNVEIRKYENLPTAYYFATDLQNDIEGKIKIVPILYAKLELDYPHIDINYNSKELYEFYKKYINDFWEKNIWDIFHKNYYGNSYLQKLLDTKKYNRFIYFVPVSK